MEESKDATDGEIPKENAGTFSKGIKKGILQFLKKILNEFMNVLLRKIFYRSSRKNL